MLNQHPAISWYSEIYRTYSKSGSTHPKWRNELKSAQVRSNRQMPGIELKGLPCQDPLIIGASLSEFIDGARELGYEHCVLLDRGNILRKLVSVQVVDQGLRSSYHQAPGAQGLSGQLVIDVDRLRVQRKFAPLREMIEYIDVETENARDLLGRSFDLLSIRYEDHIETDPTVAYDLVCKHLGLDDHQATTKLQRINTMQLSELIANFDEVEGALAGSKYEWMLRS
jgi:hypothetical protein